MEEKNKEFKIEFNIKKKFEIETWKILYFSLIVIIFLFTRLFKIMILPDGLHIDEVSMGYNTWSLSKFGTDRYGISFPVYFNNAGSGQSSLYVYIAVFLSKIFGYSEFILRFVAVLFGAMLLIFGTLLAYEIAGMTCACAMSTIITMIPYFIMSERWAFDCNAMLPMFVMSLYFFIRLLKTGKTKFAILTGIGVALTMYSYILAFIIIPVFIIFALITAVATKKLSLKNFLIMAGVVTLCASPIFLYVLVILKIIPSLKIGPINISYVSAGRLSELFWQGLSPKDILINICNLMTYDKYEFTADKNYGVMFLNKIYLFGHGIYFIQIILWASFFLLLGMSIYKLIKKKDSYEIYIVLYILACLVPILFLEDFAIYRFNAVFYGFAFILAYLFSILIGKKMLLCALFCVIYLVGNFGSYAGYLYGSGFHEAHNPLGYFDKEFLGIFENYDKLNLGDYDSVYVDDTTTYNPGLVIQYGMKATPSDIKKYTKNMDEKEGMVYKNVHIGIPKTINKKEKALYIIRDTKAGTSLYTNTYEQIELYKRLITIKDIKKQLEENKCKMKEINHYLLFTVQ